MARRAMYLLAGFPAFYRAADSGLPATIRIHGIGVSGSDLSPRQRERY